MPSLGSAAFGLLVAAWLLQTALELSEAGAMRGTPGTFSGLLCVIKHAAGWLLRALGLFLLHGAACLKAWVLVLMPALAYAASQLAVADSGRTAALVLLLEGVLAPAVGAAVVFCTADESGTREDECFLTTVFATAARSILISSNLWFQLAPSCLSDFGFATLFVAPIWASGIVGDNARRSRPRQEHRSWMFVLVLCTALVTAVLYTDMLRGAFGGGQELGLITPSAPAFDLTTMTVVDSGAPPGVDAGLEKKAAPAVLELTSTCAPLGGPTPVPAPLAAPTPAPTPLVVPTPAPLPVAEPMPAHEIAEQVRGSISSPVTEDPPTEDLYSVPAALQAWFRATGRLSAAIFWTVFGAASRLVAACTPLFKLAGWAALRALIALVLSSTVDSDDGRIAAIMGALGYVLWVFWETGSSSYVKTTTLLAEGLAAPAATMGAAEAFQWHPDGAGIAGLLWASITVRAVYSLGESLDVSRAPSFLSDTGFGTLYISTLGLLLARTKGIQHSRGGGEQEQAAPAQSPSGSSTREARPICVVCMVNATNTILYDCKHVSMCNECADKEFQGTRKCPLCRRRISRTERVYVG